MPMPQYNGPTYGYNPYQTYLPQSPWQGPQPYTQAHQGESHQVVDHVDRLMRR